MWEWTDDEAARRKKCFSRDATRVTLHTLIATVCSCLALPRITRSGVDPVTGLAEDLQSAQAVPGRVVYRGRNRRVSTNSLILQQFQRK